MTNEERNNCQTLPVLLRAIANSEQAKANKQDVIFFAAAKLIESLSKKCPW